MDTKLTTKAEIAMRLLIIDDKSSLYEAIIAEAPSGFVIDYAANYERIQSLIEDKARKPAQYQYDAIVCDNDFGGDGHDEGIRVISNLRKNGFQKTIILYTRAKRAYFTGERDIGRLKATYVQKPDPYSPRTLFDALLREYA